MRTSIFFHWSSRDRSGATVILTTIVEFFRKWTKTEPLKNVATPNPSCVWAVKVDHDRLVFVLCSFVLHEAMYWGFLLATHVHVSRVASTISNSKNQGQNPSRKVTHDTFKQAIVNLSSPSRCTTRIHSSFPCLLPLQKEQFFFFQI